MKAVRLIATKGAQVLVFDLNQPDANTTPSPLEGEPALTPEGARIDLATSNAGISEQYDYFSDKSDEWGKLLEPAFGVTDVNFRAVVVL
ncbi:HET-domain-containing protein [Fusarium oxysporum f. sp. albedinis]|nr:HET-domain-containing protein [Fusarium oxysporum f. sp. albedinis]